MDTAQVSLCEGSQQHLQYVLFFTCRCPRPRSSSSLWLSRWFLPAGYQSQHYGVPAGNPSQRCPGWPERWYDTSSSRAPRLTGTGNRGHRQSQWMWWRSCDVWHVRLQHGSTCWLGTLWGLELRMQDGSLTLVLLGIPVKSTWTDLHCAGEATRGLSPGKNTHK